MEKTEVINFSEASMRSARRFVKRQRRAAMLGKTVFFSRRIVGDIAYACLPGLLTLGVSGCAFIEKTNSDGAVTRSLVIATPVVLVEPNSPGSPRAVKATGVGLFAGDSSMMLGYYKTSKLYLDDTCRLVLMPEHESEIEKFRRLNTTLNALCVMQ